MGRRILQTVSKNPRNFREKTSPDSGYVPVIIFTETDQPYVQLRIAAEQWYAANIALNRAEAAVASGESVELFREWFVEELMQPKQDYSMQFRSVFMDVLNLIKDQ